MTPRLERVDVTRVDLSDVGVGFDVTPVWGGVPLDRPTTGSWFLRSRALAERLRRALLAGAVLYDVQLARDVNGKTFVSYRSRVHGKYASADLRKLGF